MVNSQSLKEKIIKGSLTVLILSLLGSVFAYLVRILLSRSLSIEDYGLFYATFGLFSMVTVYTDLGFGYSVVYLLPKYIRSKKYSKAWNTFIYGQCISLIMSLIISLIAISFAPVLVKYYFKVAGSEVLIYIFCTYLITFTIINSLIQIYSGMQKEKYYASITVSRWLLTLIFSTPFFVLGFSNVVFYAVALVLGHLFTVIFFLYLLFRKHTFLTSNKIIWENKIFKQMSLFAIPALLEIFVYSLAVTTDTFFLTLVKGVREVGFYNVIYPLASIPIILFNPINALLLPLVSHLMEGEKDKMVYLINKILGIVPFVGLYFVLFIIIFPSSIISLMFGQKWLGPVEIPLTVLSVGSITILMSSLLGAITLGTGRVKEKLKVAAITTALSIVLNLFLIWHLGVLGAVISSTLVSFLLSILFIRILKRIVLFQIPYRLYMKLIFFSIAGYVFVHFLNINPQNWLELISIGIVYTIIFVSFGFVLRIYDKKLISIILSQKTG